MNYQLIGIEIFREVVSLPVDKLQIHSGVLADPARNLDASDVFLG
jgi:hypothetical protein